MQSMMRKERCVKDIKRKNIYRQIGGKIAYYRKLQGLSQEELAAKINVHRSVVNRIENGNYHDNLSLDRILDISEALEIDPMIFLKFNKYERRFWDKRLADSDDEEESVED